MPKVIPIILSGGSGSRLWPISRHHYPKQLHKLYGEHTMLQSTLLRVQHLQSKPIVICNNDQRFMVAEQLQQLGIEANIVLEPVARNTAPAIVVGALAALKEDPDAIIAVFPADHVIQDQSSFEAALAKATAHADLGRLVTFGVVPTRPETGYGYIKASGNVSKEGASPVASFVEKPDVKTAESYVEDGSYFWNSGMFVFSAKRLLEEIEQFYPQMLANCKKSIEKAESDLDFLRLSSDSFSQCEDISIDYAVMEKTQHAFTVPLDAGWSDVGSWQALWEIGAKDADENVFFGDVIGLNNANTYVNATHKLVAAVGLKDVMVIDTPDAVLVVNKHATQDVKKVVEKLKADKRSEFEFHREVFRPWGSYDSVEEGQRFKVKRITVKPGAQLSLQMHHHRAEHWVVVAGTAVVRRGEEEILLSENESVYIPLGEKHRLTNPGKVDLHLVEVQSGSYLGEDDIVRFEDGYGRVVK